MRIGFHREVAYRHAQRDILARIQPLGLKKAWLADARDYIRGILFQSAAAFSVCRDMMVFQMNHSGRVRFWDGTGDEGTVELFWEKVIIIDVGPEMAPYFAGALQGL